MTPELDPNRKCNLKVTAEGIKSVLRGWWFSPEEELPSVNPETPCVTAVCPWMTHGYEADSQLDNFKAFVFVLSEDKPVLLNPNGSGSFDECPCLQQGTSWRFVRFDNGARKVFSATRIEDLTDETFSVELKLAEIRFPVTPTMLRVGP
jgi:hypothetical protein